MCLDECQEVTNVSKVKVEEHNRKAVFLNSSRENYLKTKVDGCLIKNALASDWVVSKDGTGDVFIELKGGDVDHGIVQINATLSYWNAKGYQNPRQAALIVCNQYPKINTKIQRAMEKLARTYKAPLHVMTHNYEYLFEKVLSFEGPR